MDDSSLFDLNEAIRLWRERLIQLRSLGADDLEELENHLRQSVSELQAGGLSVEEAFLVASERLGSDRRLAEEYAKTNVRRIWTGRGLWMLGGVMTWLVMDALARTGKAFVYHLSMWGGLDARLVVTLDTLAQWTICAAGIGLVWLVVRRNRWVTSTVSKCFQRPVWTGAALLLGLLGLQFLWAFVAHWWQQHHPVATLSPAGSASLRVWGFSAMLLNRLVCIAAIPLLAAYVWQATRTEAASLPALSSESLEPNERALAGQLEAQGLSRAESHLVIAWRRGYRAAPVEAQARLVSGTWLERGFWMMVGMVANWMVQDFVDRPSWLLVPSDRSLSPVWQHLGGLVSLCLPLALVGAATAALWKGATGPQKRNGWLRRLFAQSPVRGSLWFAAVAVLWVGLTAYLYLARPADAQFPAMSQSQIAMMWWSWKIILTEFFLPVIFLVWAGNRYQAGRQSV